ncbi:hypothetical protein RND81_05G072800 [Saponaria officinalis]|uniref:Uncharacterized protein n=1 Tax=Saponaria officinalis TaxID=3572 RepID=A0AAW1KV21_SAPOF
MAFMDAMAGKPNYRAFWPNLSVEKQVEFIKSLINTWKNSSIAINAESKCCTIDSSIPTSILDIVGDDGPTDSSEGKPVHEAHVAFSVEGLGDLGTETPKQSPQPPARTIFGGNSSLKKAAKKLHFRKNLNSMLDELEMEAECYVQDTEVPTRGNHIDSFLKSEDMLSPLCYTENELSSVKRWQETWC